MSASEIRETTAAIAVFAFFASGWFGWAQEDPPAAWKRPLTAASIASLLLALIGGYLTWQRWSDGSIFDQDGSTIGRTFGIIVAVEVASAGIGAAVLARTGRAELVAPWIAVVVGIHFVPLAPLLAFPFLYIVAAAVVAVAVASVPFARSRQLTVSAATGAGTGSVLLASAVVSLIMAA